ncbi:MAG: hypothetical protein WD716_09765 [Fimbriimonadaceae bacterium]
MAAKGRKWRQGAVVIVLSFVAVAVIAYLATMEDPDYVRAAKEYDSALAAARESFGALTWEDRAPRGTDALSDHALWKDVADTVPPALTRYLNEPLEAGRSPTERALFVADRDWFLSCYDRVRNLTYQQGQGEEAQLALTSAAFEIKSLVKALQVGFIGAADDGDLEGVRQTGRAMNHMIAVLNEESNIPAALLSISIRSLAQSAWTRAYVRNRGNLEVLTAIDEVVAQCPDLQAPREFVAGEARSADGYLQMVRGGSPAEINRLLNEWTVWANDYASAGETWFEEKWNDVFNKDRNMHRRIGPNAARALEARYWQAMLEVDHAFEKIEKGGSVRSESERLNNLLRTEDHSYELAAAIVAPEFIESYVRYMFVERAVAASMYLIRNYPDQSALPETLPHNVAFADPFGGEPARYRRTSVGFIIYTRSANEVDDGFELASPEQAGMEGRFMRGKEGMDWGFTVSYVPDPARG